MICDANDGHKREGSRQFGRAQSSWQAVGEQGRSEVLQQQFRFDCVACPDWGIQNATLAYDINWSILSFWYHINFLIGICYVKNLVWGEEMNYYCMFEKPRFIW